MHAKTTTSNTFPQQIFAGINLKNSNDVEFVGIKKTKTVVFLQNGSVKPFKNLQNDYLQLILDSFNGDEGSRPYFEGLDVPLLRKLEIYTYYMWGDLDHTPDIINGVLQPSENFRDCTNCPSIKFSNKEFTVHDEVLNERDLTIIDMSLKEETDIAIASRLNIAVKTLDSYKTKLFKKMGGVQSKIGLVSASYQHRLTTV
ncbi:LuxR C-terminal-related transcriptional regulator [Christiangramia sp.]|uniref:LuxR C-terminal-related transcriptional regulator n=1 Tax=Christiangramia sp. TaxID=1931228 RepID=UPI00261253F5|nr:LuxR C-terminal-related transcriptional regulator [Christiangramia sp.]